MKRVFLLGLLAGCGGAKDTSRAPVFASHSSCRALSNIPRNLTDEQIRAIAAKGGVVMVNISSMFVDQKIVDAFVAKRAALMPRIAEVAGRLSEKVLLIRPGRVDAVLDELRKMGHTPQVVHSK
jgi:microsomal dipeptidase-like Zn-dependent dipeptidase